MRLVTHASCALGAGLALGHSGGLLALGGRSSLLCILLRQLLLPLSLLLSSLLLRVGRAQHERGRLERGGGRGGRRGCGRWRLLLRGRLGQRSGGRSLRVGLADSLAQTLEGLGKKGLQVSGRRVCASGIVSQRSSQPAYAPWLAWPRPRRPRRLRDTGGGTRGERSGCAWSSLQREAGRGTRSLALAMRIAARLPPRTTARAACVRL